MPNDLKTKQQAHILAHDYGFAPYDSLKSERVRPSEDDVSSIFLANTAGQCRCLIQFHNDDLTG